MAIKPRGIRNNNPGNIEFNRLTAWDGLATPPSDGRFCIFTGPQYGLRVISKLLLAYHTYHGCNTIQDYIGRWAPSVENDTGAYIASVAKDMGVINPNKTVIDIQDVPTRAKMLYGIVHHENGEQPYPMELLTSACEMP